MTEELHSHFDEIERIHLLGPLIALGLCRSGTGLRLLHLSAGRRHCGNVVRLLRCRYRQLLYGAS